MTVREFASLSSGSAIIKIVNSDSLMLTFDSDYWQYITDAVLDLEILNFKINNQLMKKAEVSINVTSGKIANVSTQEELQAAIDDDTVSAIILTADIEAKTGDAVSMKSGVKDLYLNGHSISGPTGIDLEWGAFYVSGGTLTIIGDRSSILYGGSACGDNYSAWADGENAKIIIKGGVYDVGLDAKGLTNATIYASDGGVVIIKDGVFQNAGADELDLPRITNHILNIKDSGEAHIYCYGGTYKNENPADGDNGNREYGATFLAPGCTVSEEAIDENNVIYTVFTAVD